MPWSDLLFPNECRLDALHCLDEGIIQRILLYYMTDKKRQAYNDFYLFGKYPTSSTLHPRSLLEFSSFNGGDKRAVGFVNIFII